MNYKDYLKSKHWEDLKKEKLSKVKNVCAYCWLDFQDTHHINYKNLLDVKTEDLRLSCRECHYLIHRLEKDWFIEYDYSLGKNHQSRYLKQRNAIYKYKYWIFYRIYSRTNRYVLNIINWTNDFETKSDLYLSYLRNETICSYQLNKKIQTKLF